VGNSKEREILPFQATIEPLFAHNKQSLTQNTHNYPKTNSNAHNSTNYRGSQLKTSNNGLTEPGLRPNGFNGVSQSKGSGKVKAINYDSLNKNVQRDHARSPNFNSPGQYKAAKKEK
jgi:hypothetical protein